MINSLVSTLLTVTDAIYSRRSIRSYASDVVRAEQIDVLLRAAVNAPTAMHAEPWLFVVVQDRGALKRYSDVAKTLLIRHANVYRDLHDPSLTPRNGGFLKALGQPDFNIFYDAGTLILICARLSNAFAGADCWLGAENLMLAAPALGLATCCIGSALPAVNAPEIKAELQIPEDVTVVAAVIVGVYCGAPGGAAPQGADRFVLEARSSHSLDLRAASPTTPAVVPPIAAPGVAGVGATIRW